MQTLYMEKNEIPDNSFELTPTTKSPWYKKKKIVIPLIFFVIIVGGSSSGDSEESSSEVSASVSEPGAKESVNAAPQDEPAGGEFGDYPEDQLNFVRTIEEAKGLISDAETDLQESVALRNRDATLCEILSANKVVNWTGILKNVGANSEGKAYVDIEIADRVRVQTWNNAFSDLSDNTLVPSSSKFFDNLVAMKEGDSVTFSATFLKSNNSCLKKGNLTEVFYGSSPEFIVRFSDVTQN